MNQKYVQQGDRDDAQEITAFIENHCETNISLKELFS